MILSEVPTEMFVSLDKVAVETLLSVSSLSETS